MTRKSNRGVSIVEILIALTVFMILLIPIVSSLVTGVKTTTAAKELQYRNEYARNLMENVKEVPISVLNTADPSDPSAGPAAEYFRGIGAKDVKVFKTGNAYTITGKTNIGTQNTEYAFRINVDGNTYATINDLKNGIVEDFDQTKVALISAQLSNYDYSAYDALLTKKMAKLQQSAIDFDTINDVEKFSGDSCTRDIEVKISKNTTNDYVVQCTLTYQDGTFSVKYVPYVQTFKKLPNIYLMYNAGVYNGRYTKDTITYDLGNVTEDVNVFVVTTKSNYSGAYESLASSEGVKLKNTTGGSVLYRTTSSADRTLNPINFINKTPSQKDHLYVYHNFADTDIGMTVNYNVSDTGDFKNGNVGSLNDAQDGRGMYQVKIHMQKGSSINLDVDPVLEGTRGGDEIE